MANPIELTPVSPPKGRKILVVDDDRLNRRLLAAILRPEGYEVVEAETAEKQTKIVLLSHERPPLRRLDPNKIRQVVDNLLNNAAKYSPPGSTAGRCQLYPQRHAEGGGLR